MPSLTFVLPHWLYWSGLILFPIVAMVIVRRQRARGGHRPAVTPGIGYLLWLGGGFVGLHRFYLRNLWGLVYIPLFLAILYGNVEGRTARNAVSEAHANVASLEVLEKRYERRVERGSSSAKRRLESIRKEIAAARKDVAGVDREAAYWSTFSGGFAASIGLLLIIDAFWLPRLIRRCNEREGVAPPPASLPTEDVDPVAVHDDPARGIRTRFTRAVDALSGWTGEFVAFWSIIAVFVYYYEVLARYVFNSPTNWAHESMFLMFGMQYLIAGAYALREDAHVRVDVLYGLMSPRGQVITDIVTSFFFFVFTATLLVTGTLFFVDSVKVFEVSFTEWAIQYWPVKAAIPIGAALILLQGIAHLTRDVLVLSRRRA